MSVNQQSKLYQKIFDLIEENKNLKFQLTNIQNNLSTQPKPSQESTLNKKIPLFGKVFEQSSLPILITDISLSEILEANNAAQKLLEYSEESIEGKAFHVLFPDVDPLKILEISSENDYKPIHKTHVYTQADEVKDIELFSGKFMQGGIEYFYHILHDVSELIQKNKKLKQSERNFRLLIHKSPLAILVTDYKGKIRYVNKKFKTLFSISNEVELNSISEWAKTAIPVEEEYKTFMGRFHYVLNEFRQMNTVLPEYLKLYTSSCEKVEVEVHYTAIGKHILLTVNDLTILRKTERKAIENFERFKKAFQLNPLPMCVTSLEDGRFIDVNRAFLKASGYEIMEVIGQTSTELQFFKDKNFRSKFKEEISESTSIMSYPIVLVNKFGDERICELSADVITINGEKVILNVILDKTEQIQDVKKKIASEKRFKDLLSQIELFAVILDKNANILYCNEYLRRRTGYSNIDLLNKNWFSIFNANNKWQERNRLYTKRIRSGKIDARHDILMIVKSGKRRIIRWNNTILRNENDEIVGVASIGRDITESTKNLKALKQAKQKAEEADKIKSVFLANMSHEIRTPLNGILGFTELLKFTNDNEQRNKFLDIINSNGKLLLSLISDIIDIAKIEANQIKIIPVEFNLNELMNNLHYQYENSGYSVRKPNIELFVNLDESLNDKQIVFDESRLKQILTNLLNNAYKFTEKGSISFGYSREEDMLRFYVSDTGRGIAKDHQQAIFNQFWQVQVSDSKVHGGTGLGLAISKALVNRMKGSIGLESEVGKGSEFWFTIPLKFAPVRDKSENTINTAQETWENKNFLLVEDDQTNIEYASTLIENKQGNVNVVNNGKVAYELLSECNNEIDVAIIDIRLPGLDGINLVKHLRANNCITPLVAFSAYAMQDDIQLALRAGFNDFIVKPVNPSTFYSVVQKYI
jgi:PAS domain S-box-containing protein